MVVVGSALSARHQVRNEIVSGLRCPSKSRRERSFLSDQHHHRAEFLAVRMESQQVPFFVSHVLLFRLRLLRHPLCSPCTPILRVPDTPRHHYQDLERSVPGHDALCSFGHRSFCGLCYFWPPALWARGGFPVYHRPGYSLRFLDNAQFGPRWDRILRSGASPPPFSRRA